MITTSFRNLHSPSGHHTPVLISVSDQRIRSFCSELSERLDSLLQKKLQTNFDNGYVTLNACDAIRVLAAIDPRSKVVVPIKNLLLKMATQAQHEAGGSAFIALSVCP